MHLKSRIVLYMVGMFIAALLGKVPKTGIARPPAKAEVGAMLMLRVTSLHKQVLSKEVKK